MLQIFTRIPLFVWPLFLFLLVTGLRARKLSKVPLTIVLLVPCFFFVWSFLTFFGKYPLNGVGTYLWIVSLAGGFFVGYFYMRQQVLAFDKKDKKVEIPGSWIPLILSMTIFVLKFLIGIVRALYLHLQSSFFVLGLELFATFVLGIFMGRGINCLIRYRRVSL